MTEARALVQQIAQDLSAVETALREHPYPRGFRAGRLPLEGLVPFLGHQYHIAHTDIQSAARLISNFDDGLASGFFRGLLEGEFAGLAGILRMAEKIGLSEDDLERYEPSPDGFAYGAYVNLLASHATQAEVMCGFLVNLPAWGFNCGQIGDGLRETFGWPRDDTAFVDGFAALPAFDDEALPVIQQGLDRGESPTKISRVARLIQGYEKMFWDAMAREAGLE